MQGEGLRNNKNKTSGRERLTYRAAKQATWVAGCRWKAWSQTVERNAGGCEHRRPSITVWGSASMAASQRRQGRCSGGSCCQQTMASAPAWGGGLLLPLLAAAGTRRGHPGLCCRPGMVGSRQDCEPAVHTAHSMLRSQQPLVPQRGTAAPPCIALTQLPAGVMHTCIHAAIQPPAQLQVRWWRHNQLVGAQSHTHLCTQAAAGPPPATHKGRLQPLRTASFQPLTGAA